MKIMLNPPSINNNGIQNINFKSKFYENPKEIGNLILANPKKLKLQAEIAKGTPPRYLVKIGNLLKKIAKNSETLVNKDKLTIENLVNKGNIAKEAVCMIVYPAQVLTNPDLDKDKRRFVGFYDFYVTCFSLAGAILYDWKGDAFMKKAATTMLNKSLKGKVVPRMEKAAKGGAFVIGIALQTILFKRVLAPAIAPILAGKTREYLEAKDAAKAQKKNAATQKNNSNIQATIKNNKIK